MPDIDIIKRLIRGMAKLGFLKAGFRRLLVWPVVCLVLGALLWYSVLSKIAAEKAEFQGNALSQASMAAQAYAQYVANAIEQIDQITLRVKLDWQHSHGKPNPNLVELAESGVFRSSQILVVMVIDRHGMPIAVTPNYTGQFRQVSLADTDYFRFHQNDRSNVLLVGNPVTGRITGRRIILLTRRLEAADGSFDGVVLASVTPDYFTSFNGGSNPGKTGLLALVGNDGALRSARIGDAAQPLASPAFRAIPIFDTLRGATVLEGKPWFADERTRFVAWETLKTYPLVAMAGIAEEELTAPYRKTWALYRQLAVAGRILLLLLALAGIGWSARLAWKEHYSEEVRKAYRIATEGGNEGFYMLRPLRDQKDVIVDFEVVDCNERGAAFYGVERRDLLGTKFSSRSRPSSFDALMPILLEATESGFYEGEIEIPRNSRLQLAWARLRLVRAGTGLAVTVQDISERKELEAARTRLAAIVENSNDAIISRALDGTILSWNAAAERLLGYAAAEVIGKSITMIMPVDQQRAPELHSRLILQGDRIPPMEVAQRTKDGRLIDVLRSISPVRNDAGEVVGAAILLSDITERKRAESQRRLAASVFDNAAEGIMITDKDNNILTVNSAFTEITGYSAAEVLGKNPRLFSSGRQAPAFYDEMWASINTSGRWQGEVWDVRKSGESYCELLSISAVRDEHGKLTHYCAVIADVTRRKIAESQLVAINAELEERVARRTAELKDANNELEAFSYSVSHDLRAPLRHINGYSAIVLRENAGKLDEASVDYLKKINAASERMGLLIHDLLTLSRISRQELRKRQIDLSEVAGEVVNSLVTMQPGRHVRVTVAPEMKAKGDPGLVRIVLENLIGNAWKFTSRASEPTIDIGHEERDGETTYYIRDNGAGFDMKYADKLFVPFQRLHSDREFQGTGIGLSIVQRIVARHGGKIQAEGKEGEGASFRFTLGTSERSV